MSVTIRELLDDLRKASLDERDKGDRFERLVKAYLSNEPEWTARFKSVYLWREWPGRGNRPDTGIDLVAVRRDGEGLAAIQCKFYAEGHKVAKSDIDSFVSASAKSEWTERFVFDTAAGWTGNAEETLEGVAQRIDIAFLDDARVDWSKYSWSKPDQVELATAHQPRRHQKAAIDAVTAGLSEHDRGKMIMACGTGKTFTALRLAERQVGTGGTVLFLVPSIQLLSQSLREWMAQSEVDIRPFAVCSDVRVGRKAGDSGDLSTIDLTEPATTDAGTLVARMTKGKHSEDRMTVVFSTYQSIDVISQAQAKGLGEFDLIICDEAHRTTGVTLANQAESHFVKVHEDSFISAAKRVYMTATPRVFDDAVTRKAIENDAVLADMADENTFGPELYRLGFGEAVEQNLLTDYKVIVLTVDETYVAEHFQQTMAHDGEIQLDDAAKLLGCWQGLAKNYGSDEENDGAEDAPMRRAVAFAKDIRASQTASRAFPALIERALEDESRHVSNDLRVEAVHIDGTMGIHERNKHLDWLKSDAGAGVCRVLTNARCLSEGVDVPALDAVMFLTPRGSQVDVVQSVGRVMRKDPSGVKKLGYIILPVVIPSGMKPSEALNDNKRYKVVWQVLQALRSHDDRFHALVNQIDLNKKKNTKIDIVDGTPPRYGDGEGDGADSQGPDYLQPQLEYGFDGFRDAMYARIVKKVGERTYWEDWASDIADIAQTHITRIAGLLQGSELARERFDTFLQGLRGNLNESITEDQAIEMLAQHLITRPVFEALFAGYDFAANNPVAQTMEDMLAVLDDHALGSENATLRGFYDSVRRRVAGVDNAEGRQKILVELYNNFFAKAFKKTVNKLGIVYTPVEIVDFILRSADEVLRQEFGQSLTDEGVHILDGFAGTGTFIVRLLQLGLIEPHDIARKYAEEIHANEILLLAYYIAAVNIETTYADLVEDPAPFPGLVLTDTFQSYEDGDRQDLDIFPENNERIVRQRELPITVIVGNPPWSVGQSAANDDNANERYAGLDDSIRDTYVARSSAGLSRNLYDSYVRAFRWASSRLNDRGVVALVSNSGWLDSRSADGMRKAIADEFTSVYVYNLRGNVRSGEAEGGNVFPITIGVAVTLLVRNPNNDKKKTIKYVETPDNLSKKEKLSLIDKTGTIFDLPLIDVSPDDSGDWLNQRSARFTSFLPNVGQDGIFAVSSKGIATNRDPWCYSFGTSRLVNSVERLVSTYRRALHGDVSNDPTEISWSRSLRKRLGRGRDLDDASHGFVRSATYRPFNRTHCYYYAPLNELQSKTATLFPDGQDNPAFYQVGMTSEVPFSVLAFSGIPDLHLTGAGSGGEVFARWRYEPVDPEVGTLDLAAQVDDSDDIVGGYRRIDNITDYALERFRATYSDEVLTKDDIFSYVYGLLHSPEYRKTYTADLKKMLPRIPLVADFRGFADAGRALFELHLGYEDAEPYSLDGLAVTSTGDPFDFFAVGDKKMKFGGKRGIQDKSIIHYNDRITLSGIPDDAYRYTIGKYSAIEWIIERYRITIDTRGKSGIVNDPNDWSREVGDPRYVLDLLARIVTVSIETMKIVDALPPLDIIETE